jgi:hypothetical protein
MSDSLNEPGNEAEGSPTARTAPYIVAVIHKDAVEHLPVVVHPHEMPILALVHGEHKLQHDENADLPKGVSEATFEPEDEFVRLEQRYGVHPDTKRTYAAMIFGDAAGLAEQLDSYESVESARTVAPKTTRTVAAKKTAKKA